MNESVTHSLPATTIQCPWCDFVNVVSRPDELCKNCGLELERLLRAQAEDVPVVVDPAAGVAALDPRAVVTPSGKVLVAPSAEACEKTRAKLIAVGPIALPFGSRDGVEGSVGRPGASPVKRWVPAFVFAGILAVAIVATLLVLMSASARSGMSQTAAAESPVEMQVEGWDATPAWVAEVAGVHADATAVTRDGHYLGVTDGRTAWVIDAETGGTVATQPIVDDATSRIYSAGDMLILVGEDTVTLWTEEHDTDMAPGWTTATLPDDATVLLRGDIFFVSAEVGVAYQRLNVDATLTPVDVPTEGAVPVAATGDTITWGTNKGVAYLSDIDGKHVKKMSLTRPADMSHAVRWVGGDFQHVYVVWESDKALQLVVHSLATGKSVARHTLATRDLEAKPTATREGAHVSFAGILIDASTGAITETPNPVTAAVGDRFLVDGENGPAIMDPARPDLPLEPLGDVVSPLTFSPAGELVVVGDGKVAALASQG